MSLFFAWNWNLPCSRTQEHQTRHVLQSVPELKTLDCFNFGRLSHASRKEETWDRRLLGSNTIWNNFALAAGSSDWHLDWQCPLNSNPNSHLYGVLWFNYEQSAVQLQDYFAALNSFFPPPQYINQNSPLYSTPYISVTYFSSMLSLGKLESV